MTDAYSAAPRPGHRLIPSKFPPIGLFDTVATAADLEAVLELAGWTNDRLVLERLRRLPEDEWVYGRPNSSIVMASFLHVQPAGVRFNGPDLGAWYEAAALTTAVFEVAHHLRREAVATGKQSLSREFRAYTAELDGSYLDIRGKQAQLAEVYASDTYAASQVFGESVRASGGAGIVFDSVRHLGGTCAVCFRPRSVLGVVQSDHWRVRVEASSPRVGLRKLSAAWPLTGPASQDRRPAPA